MRKTAAIGIVVAAALAGGVACDRSSGRKTPAAPPAQLGDLTASLAPAREAFNARRGEPRFLMLLAPT